MSEFTKGKWEYDYILGVITNSKKNNTVAKVLHAAYFPYTQNVTPEGEANAHLIAAAPEMYELLRVCMKKFHCSDKTYRRIEKLIERIDGNSLKGGETSC